MFKNLTCEVCQNCEFLPLHQRSANNLFRKSDQNYSHPVLEGQHGHRQSIRNQRNIKGWDTSRPLLKGRFMAATSPQL